MSTKKRRKGPRREKWEESRISLLSLKNKKSISKSGQIDEVIEIFDDEVDCSGVKEGTATAIDISNRHGGKAAGCATSSFVKDYAEDDDYIFDDEFHDWMEQPAAVAESQRQDEDEDDEAPCAPASNTKALLGSSTVNSSDLKKLRSKRRIVDDDDDDDEDAVDCDLGPSAQSSVLLDITNKVVPASPLPKKEVGQRRRRGELDLQ